MKVGRLCVVSKIFELYKHGQQLRYEKKMAKSMASYFAYMDEDNTYLMKINLNCKAKLMNFDMHTKGHKTINQLEEQAKMNCK